MDFAFDPFNNRRLVVGQLSGSCCMAGCNCTVQYAACDDCYIRVWTLPKDGLTEMLTEPDFKLTGIINCIPLPNGGGASPAPPLQTNVFVSVNLLQVMRRSVTWFSFILKPPPS